MEDQLAKALQGALECYQGMSHGYAYVAEDGGVGEVALQAAYRQFGCQELQNGIGHAEVAFGVLVVDGIHLVGHGT